MIISAPGHAGLTTHLFVANSPYIESDAVFGVRESLIVEFDRHEPGKAPDGRTMTTPYWSAHYDFRLSPDGAVLRESADPGTRPKKSARKSSADLQPANGSKT
jgi:hypothetical protein